MKGLLATVGGVGGVEGRWELSNFRFRKFGFSLLNFRKSAPCKSCYERNRW